MPLFCALYHYSIVAMTTKGHMRFVGELYKVELLKEKHVQSVSALSLLVAMILLFSC